MHAARLRVEVRAVRVPDLVLVDVAAVALRAEALELDALRAAGEPVVAVVVRVRAAALAAAEDAAAGDPAALDGGVDRAPLLLRLPLGAREALRGRAHAARGTTRRRAVGHARVLGAVLRRSHPRRAGQAVARVGPAARRWAV